MAENSKYLDDLVEALLAIRRLSQTRDKHMPEAVVVGHQLQAEIQALCKYGTKDSLEERDRLLGVEVFGLADLSQENAILFLRADQARKFVDDVHGFQARNPALSTDQAAMVVYERHVEDYGSEAAPDSRH